ncbi:MAG: amidohydrolase family protein, partial [Acidimicrobiia bacterium]
MADLLITNARIADGTGNPLRRANIAVEGDRIAGVGRLEGVVAKRTIDAGDRLVCPGFVDPHSHSDRTVLSNPEAHSTIRQGVTTEIVGNCGHTLAPVTEHNLDNVQSTLSDFGYAGQVEWSTFGEMLGVVARQGTSQNLGWLVGHNAVRGAAGAGSAPVTDAQLDAMRAHVDEAMRAGALGLSTGLEFRPGSWATTEEIVELNKVVGQHDGIYASHVRNRDEFLQEAVEEFIRVVREGGTRGEFSHLNVRHNSGV